MSECAVPNDLMQEWAAVHAERAVPGGAVASPQGRHGNCSAILSHPGLSHKHSRMGLQAVA